MQGLLTRDDHLAQCVIWLNGVFSSYSTESFISQGLSFLNFSHNQYEGSELNKQTLARETEGKTKMIL